MIKIKEIKKTIKPIVEDSDSMVLAWHCPNDDLSQVVINGHPIDMLSLIARTMYRIEECFNLPLEIQLEALEEIYNEIKKGGLISTTLEAGEKRSYDA